MKLYEIIEYYLGIILTKIKSEYKPIPAETLSKYRIFLSPGTRVVISDSDRDNIDFNIAIMCLTNYLDLLNRLWKDGYIYDSRIDSIDTVIFEQFDKTSDYSQKIGIIMGDFTIFLFLMMGVALG